MVIDKKKLDITKEIFSHNRSFDDKKIFEGIKMIMTGLNLDLKDENFRDTPNRVLRSYYEIFEGLDNEKEIKNILSTSFPTTYDGMVMEGPIKCFSMCPHHLIPVLYSIYIAYIPRKGGLGLSKLPRVVELLAKRPALQEDFTKDIVRSITNTIKPRGVAVMVKGEHMCMQMRGVEKIGCGTITSEVTGYFKDNAATKEEFLKFVNFEK